MKKIALFLLTVFYCISASAQNREVDSIIDLILFDDEDMVAVDESKKNYHFLYLRSNYDSKTYYAGREIGDKQYNLSSQLYYFNSIGFYTGVAGAWYSQIDPGYRITVLSAGYSKSIAKLPFMRLRASYDHFLYANTTDDFEPIYFGALNAGITLKKKWLGARFNYAMTVGKEFGKSLSCDLFSSFKLYKFGAYDGIEFEPEVSVYFNSESVDFIDDTYSTTLLNLPPVYLSKEEFGLLNTQISLPLSISYKDFDFQISYNYNLPHSLDDNYEYAKSSYINISLGYIFSVK